MLSGLLADLARMLSYGFMARAMLIGVLVALCSSLLGVSLVLKRYSMIGDGLSKVGFGSLAVAAALNYVPLTISVPAVVAAAFLLLRLSENSSIKGDAAIALLSTGAMAVGVLVIARTTGMNTDVCNYMFGSIINTTPADAWLSVGLAVVCLVLYVLFYHKIFAVTFDESFARATGTRVGVYNTLIALLTAVTIVLGMQMMGAMLISAVIIFPALTAMRVCKTFRSVVICAAVVSELCFVTGLTASYLIPDLPTGACIVVVNIAALALFSLVGLVRRAWASPGAATF